MKYIVRMAARTTGICDVEVEAVSLADAKSKAIEASVLGDWEVREAPEADDIRICFVQEMR